MKARGKWARQEHLVIHMLLTRNTPPPDNLLPHDILHPEYAEKYSEPESDSWTTRKSNWNACIQQGVKGGVDVMYLQA